MPLFWPLSLLVSFADTKNLTPPVAPTKPHELVAHGEVRQDPYFWLRNREDAATLSYLKAENSYADAVMRPHKALEKKILKEMKSHIREEDESYPMKARGYFYQSRIRKGQEYRQHWRWKAEGPKREELILDENVLAKGFDYMHLDAIAVSDDGNLLAYSVDLKGDRNHRIYFKDLRTGKLLEDQIPDVEGDVAWAADNQTIYYVKREPVTLRSRWVYRHKLGETKDTLVYDEKDEKFDVEVQRSFSKRVIFINSGSKDSSETRWWLASEPLAEPRLFQAREPGVLYGVDDGGDRFFVSTNWKAENFRLLETSPTKTERNNWKEVVAHQPDVYLQNVSVFQTHIVLEERTGGLIRFRLMNRADTSVKSVSFPEKDYFAGHGENGEYTQTFFRYGYESMTTPESIFDVDFASGESVLRKREKVPGGFSAENYESQRLEATASDGTHVPISLVYKKGLRRGEKTPLLLYGYGSYGYAIESYFSPTRLALLDRGFVFAVAHPRGGSEMGRAWYLNGKMMKKKNTFTDFIACAEHLVKEGWTSPGHLYAKGESAGGLLMGAVINMRPDLFHGIVAGVPFVDVLTTMLDSTLPLTTAEYEEWGNPNEKPAYDYIKSYSPYDNVKAQVYPNMLVRAGLNDTQVSYWEPAKWVAKLRQTKVGNGKILFMTEMGAGHHGKNGRFSGLEQIARETAFLVQLDQGKL